MLLLNCSCVFSSINWFVSLLPSHIVFMVPMLHNSGSNCSATQSLLMMPALSPSMKISMQYTAEQGIGATLVLEYFYFLYRQPMKQTIGRHVLDLAAKEYQTSGTQASVCKLIGKAFHEHDADRDLLCPILWRLQKRIRSGS
ncbi:hypothetical protein EDC04DRAFT_1805054 [Pisolithus marmoratus]|nr:hypothetical protein EDC04DRAFT_1805054 [Pisolithus marmoratus]